MGKIIFFDIDGTLLGKDAGLNLGNLAKYFKRKKEGVVFGINTNRPLGEAVKIFNKLRLNGPIISENGAVYRLNIKSEEKIVNHAAVNLNKKIINFLEKILPSRLPKRALVVSSDKSLLKNAAIVFISKDRKYTSSIYVGGRKSGSNQRKDLVSILELLREKFGKNKLINFKGNFESMKIIASHGFSDRISTMRYVGRRYFPGREIFLISDDETVRRGKGSIFCGVKNATKEYKEKCEIVTKITGWRGIKDLVEKIIKK